MAYVNREPDNDMIDFTHPELVALLKRSTELYQQVINGRLKQEIKEITESPDIYTEDEREFLKEFLFSDTKESFDNYQKLVYQVCSGMYVLGLYEVDLRASITMAVGDVLDIYYDECITGGDVVGRCWIQLDDGSYYVD